MRLGEIRKSIAPIKRQYRYDSLYKRREGNSKFKGFGNENSEYSSSYVFNDKNKHPTSNNASKHSEEDVYKNK